jgi:hypothetical protein
MQTIDFHYGAIKISYINFLFIPILVVSVSCWPTRDLRNFTLYGETKSVENKRLKINGVFCTVIERENNTYQNQGRIECFVLYDNGTYLDLNGNVINGDKNSAIGELIRHFEKNRKLYSNTISQWGVFKMISDTIHIQRYLSIASSSIRQTSKVIDLKMKILNDSTLVEINDAQTDLRSYSLYRISDKPDSTNLFSTNERIKNKLNRFYEKRHTKKVK